MARDDRRAQQGRSGKQGASSHTHEAAPTLTDEQREALGALVAQVPTLAQTLREAQAAGRGSIASQLAPITHAPEPVALAFAMQLGDVRGAGAGDAADVATALGELEARRDVAREARRSRLRLRSTGVAATLSVPPVALVSSAVGARTTDGSAAGAVASAPTARKPRLVEAHVTRTREGGDVTLVLGWQEGSDAELVRAYLMELDFWHDGVRHFAVTETMSRRRLMRETIDELRKGDGTERVSLVSLTWAQARHLVAEALAVNEWRGTVPTELSPHRAQVEARLLAEPEDDETRAAIEAEEARFAREGDRPYMTADMEPDEMLANWIGGWSFGDYGLVYDLFADEHPLRRAQTRNDFIALRRRWADEAKPVALRLGLLREQARRASALWVPGAAGSLAASTNHEYEAFWSLALTESQLGGQLDELPMATLASKETGRHWFWTGYTVARDRASAMWLIARQRDEGAASQGLSIEELQQRIKEARNQAEEAAKTAPANLDVPNEQAMEVARTITGAITSSLHYADALIARLPLDETVYREALEDARVLGNYERSAALLERLYARTGQSTRLRFELGIEQYLVAEQYGEQGEAEAATIWLDRAIATLTEVIATEPTVEHIQALGELLARRGRVREAEAQLREAVALDPQRATAYVDLASVIMAHVSGEGIDDEEQASPEQRDRLTNEALAHLREAARLDSSVPRLFTRIGAVYEVLHQHDDALLAFEEALRRDPSDAEAQYTLGALRLHRNEPEVALPLLQQAVQLAPLAVPARLSLATAYLALDHRREATQELDLIDQIAPNLPQVAELRAQLARAQKKR